MCRGEIIKKTVLAGLFSLGFGFCALAQDQTVKINIQIPAGVGMSIGGGSSNGNTDNGSNRISDSNLDFSIFSEDGILIPLFWIKMQSLENSQFLIGFKNDQGLAANSVLYFLNNNTDELQSAYPVTQVPALLQFSKEGKLIRNFVPRRTSLYSWIGLSRDPSMTTVIEYF